MVISRNLKKLDTAGDYIIYPMKKDYLTCLLTMNKLGLKSAIALRCPIDGLDEIVERSKTYSIRLEFDMQNESIVDETIETYLRVKVECPDSVICLQAYLQRTIDDLKNIKNAEPNIRIVKGAFNAKGQCHDISENFIKCVGYCLENDLNVKIATHDQMLVDMFQDLRLQVMHGYGKDFRSHTGGIEEYVLHGNIYHAIQLRNIKWLIKKVIR
ncbi:hypothetical protein COV93_02685 [Candidatus Woesearchaeota archaeon CG11_big_fil_rev_8_21_14_0_20_43_8]|nr:MAG: hypothetical protein COV93_02685 [Candidatus Woesearchaeota archaeon CG11_big_fil_rev_8_21_14_0_20_43_8]PIO07088.1 MAG: hypothetical protein COT47_01540 [Candidatus Woesearchaeota archaeon CG08_land_8_20_14_0_20_43_7]